MKYKVIDVSYAQQNIDWTKVKTSGVSAAIIRNGYLNRTDTTFEQNVKGAKAAGLHIGTYTYILSETVEQAIAEAKATIERLSKFKGYFDYPVFADIEDSKYYDTAKYTKQLRTEILLAFLETVRKAGYYPAVYINPAWLEQWIDKTRIVGHYDIWLAAWTEDPSKNTKFSYGQKMWQWGVDRVNGINGDVDGDLCYVDYPNVIKTKKMNFLKSEMKSSGDTKTASVKTVTSFFKVYKSLGTAAVRSDTSRAALLKSRVAKSKHYVFDMQINMTDGSAWLRHIDDIPVYSMLSDSGKLFEEVSTCTKARAKTKLNVRANPSIAGNKIRILSQNEIVYKLAETPVKADGHEWVHIAFGSLKDGYNLGYVAREYLEG